MKAWKSLFVGCALTMVSADMAAADNGDTLKAVQEKGDLATVK